MINKSNWIKITTKILTIALCTSFFFNCKKSKNQQIENNTTEWLLVDKLKTKSSAIEISGNPQIIKSSYGNAVYFNGVDDALFINEMPLKSLNEFTIEMIFNPALNAPFEQRVVHMGEVSGDRMLLEIRAVENNWYFDGFVASGENKLTLIDESLLHPLGQWYHVALVVTQNSLSTYVNGKLELTESYTFNPIETGQSSVGVRLNKRSWFKGDIYKVKICPKQLSPDEFMSF